MRLLIDLGNTRCKWVLVQAATWLEQGTGDHIADLSAQWACLPQPTEIIGCAVGNACFQAEISILVQQRWQQDIHWISPSAHCGSLHNDYENPQQLGADRWAAALGAQAHFPAQNLLIISAGTALVVDALHANGHYLGGLILPGYRLMKESLNTGTARLPLADGQVMDFPRNTRDAIESGVIAALCGAIAKQRSHFAAEDAVLTLIFGGDATRLAAHLNGPIRVMENLVLHGLSFWASSQENAQ